MKNRLVHVLILCTSQFGYHLDTYYYCKYGRDTFKITYLGFEGSRRQLFMEDIHVKNVSASNKDNKIRRWLRWLWATLCESHKDYDVVFVKYFPGCSIIKILNYNRSFILDIRTGAIDKSRWRRAFLDFILKCESFCFHNITVISKSLAEKLGLPSNKIHILPLGADPIETKTKRFDRLDLLYVGTFSGRELEKTIIGFERFYKEHNDKFPITFTLVGDGYNGERDKLKILALELGLKKPISLPGFVHHNHLMEYWERSNVGISFVPINDIYDVQPPTKTFEYILAGMPVIATNTMENRYILNEENGILIDDTSDEVYMGLKKIMQNRTGYQSDKIKSTCEKFHWKKIVKDNFCPYLLTINKTFARKINVE